MEHTTTKPSLSYTGQAYDPANAPLCAVTCAECGETAYYGPLAQPTTCPYCMGPNGKGADIYVTPEGIELLIHRTGRPILPGQVQWEPVFQLRADGLWWQVEGPNVRGNHGYTREETAAYFRAMKAWREGRLGK